ARAGNVLTPKLSSGPALSAVAFFAGAAQGIGKRPASGLRCGLARRRSFRGDTGLVARSALRILLADLIVKAQRQRDALAGPPYLQHLDLDDVARLDDFARVLDEVFRHCGDVNQAILVHADVDEGTECCDVGNGTLQDHTGLEILDLLD